MQRHVDSFDKIRLKENSFVSIDRQVRPLKAVFARDNFFYCLIASRLELMRIPFHLYKETSICAINVA